MTAAPSFDGREDRSLVEHFANSADPEERRAGLIELEIRDGKRPRPAVNDNPVPKPTIATVDGERVQAPPPAREAPIADRRLDTAAIEQAAHDYMARGWNVLPLDPATKQAIGTWGADKKRIDHTHVHGWFGGGENIAVVLGGTSAGICDIDCDWSEFADMVGRDPILKTLPCFGRKSAPNSHRIFASKDALAINGDCRIVKFALPDSMARHARLVGDDHKLCIAELRANGHYTMFPPSIHPSGEEVTWHEALGPTLPLLEWQAIRNRIGLNAFLSLCVRCYPERGNRNEYCLALGGALLAALRHRYSETDEQQLVEDVDDTVYMIGDLAGGKDSHRIRAAANTWAKIKSGAAATGLPTVMRIMGFDRASLEAVRGWLGIDADELPHILWDENHKTQAIDASMAALVEHQAPIFQRAGRIMAVAKIPNEEAREGVTRAAGSLVIREVSDHRLHEHVSESANWRSMITSRSGKRIEVKRPPGRDFCGYLRGREELPFRVITGLSNTPFLRPDGTLCKADGFDQATGIVLDCGGVDYSALKECPTKADAEAALAVLQQPYEEFPIPTKEAKAVALSEPLCILARPALDLVPCHINDAPQRASGKTLLADVAAIIGTGRECPAITMGANEEELEKRLDGALLAGDQVILLDNVTRPLEGDKLAAMITKANVGIRTLGKSGQTEVRNRAVVIPTGCNVQAKGDLPSRCIACRIVPDTDNPEQREFKRADLRGWTLDHRTELVIAGLTIVLAYIAAGRPILSEWNMKPSRMPAYDRTVRGALIWLGVGDPMATQAELKLTDTARGDLGALIAACRSTPGLFGKRPATEEFSAKELAEAALANVELSSATGTATPGDVRKAAEAVCPKGIITDKALSKYLRSVNGTPVGEWCFEATHDSDKHAWRFRLRRLSWAEPVQTEAAV